MENFYGDFTFQGAKETSIDLHTRRASGSAFGERS